MKGGMRGEGGGVCGMHAPLLQDTASQCAVSTHPTGMHSYTIMIFVLFDLIAGPGMGKTSSMAKLALDWKPGLWQL